MFHGSALLHGRKTDVHIELERRSYPPVLVSTPVLPFLLLLNLGLLSTLPTRITFCPPAAETKQQSAAEPYHTDAQGWMKGASAPAAVFVKK